MVTTSMMTSTMGNDQFYPTPGKLAGMMVSGIDWNKVHTILEPSAGKGDLLKCAAKAFIANGKYGKRYAEKIEADCIEIDSYLRQILAYNFSEESIGDSEERYKQLDRRHYSPDFTDAEKKELKALRGLRGSVENVDMRIAHDDFLSFRGHKRYDLIIMNPPFAQGGLHLLKALELQKNGGQIVCLLNAETIRSPYNKTCQLLNRKLMEYGANITFIGDAFKNAERVADVDVAIVKIDIPTVQRESTIYERMKKAAEQETPVQESADLIYGDFIELLVNQYNIEVSASLELIREYEALVPYMLESFPTDDSHSYNYPILNLSVGSESRYRGSKGFDTNRYLKGVRRKYWCVFLNNKKIIGRLTSKLQNEYRESVDKMAEYDFSMFNIMQVKAEIESQIIEGGDMLPPPSQKSLRWGLPAQDS